MHDLELFDIQGNILRGYNQPFSRFHFYRIGVPADGQRFLARLVPQITTAEPWGGAKPVWTLNVAFTCKGVGAMGMPDEVMSAFPFEFRKGMAKRAEVLVDRGESAPANWEEPWADGVHMLVFITANSAEERDRRSEWLRTTGGRFPRVQEVGQQDAGKLFIDGAFSSKEHFGYVDGIGNPDMYGGSGKRALGGGQMQPDGQWRPIASGEFLLGHHDEADEVAPTPRPVRLFRNGSFMVYRKLEQRVLAFRRFVAEEGEKYHGGAEHFKAKLVGRWPDGTPLMLSPEKPDPAIADDPHRNLDFHYSADPLGAKCPLGAHIRRANPRDATGFAGELSNRHRVIRRGVFYGEPLPANAPLDGDDTGRGIIFVAYNASLERQFEFVQQQWMNFGNDFQLGNDKDPLIGSRDGPLGLPGPKNDKLTIQGEPGGAAPWLTNDLPTFVVTRGGDYFFTPSLSGCRFLAAAEGELEPLAYADPEVQTSLMDRLKADLGALDKRLESNLAGFPAGVAIDQALHVLGGDLETFGAHLKAWAMKQNPEPVFALLRRFKPILVLSDIAIVTRSADAQQVLSYPTMFNVPYTDKFTELCDGGGFMLGWDDTPEYTRDLSAMRLVIRREDLPTRIAPFVAKAASAIVDGAPGRLDIVKELGMVVPTQFVGDYFGTPNPPGGTFAEQAAVMSAYLFLPVGDFQAKAMAAAKSMRPILQGYIDARKGSRGRMDDVLVRCLVLQDAGTPGMDDASLLNNLFGMVVGAIPTTAAAVARALDELLRRPAELARAQDAARLGNTALVTRYVFEAMRFNPLGPGVFRIAAADFEVAGGTLHATTIPAGRHVLVALQSASFDGDRVPNPDEFDIERPLPEYLHFGFGLHTCFGRYINAVQIPAIVAAVLRKQNLRRAAGEAGTLQVDGPFPSSLVVEFDP